MLEAQPEVFAAHVVGVPHPERGEVVAAAVVLRDGARVSGEDLRERLRGELSAYKLPRHVLLLTTPELPMTASGKLDRRRLRSELERRLAGREAGRA